MNVSLKTAFAFFFSRKKKGIIHFITFIAIAGIMSGSMALTLVLSVFNGFEKVIFDNFSPLSPDLKILHHNGKGFEVGNTIFKYFDDNQDKLLFNPTLEEKVLIKNKDEAAIGIIKGVPDNFFHKKNREEELLHGAPLFYIDNKPLAIVGYDLYYQLNIETGSSLSNVEVYAPTKNTLHLLSPQKNFYKSRISTAGVTYYYFDTANVMYVPLEWLQKRMKNNKINALDIYVKNKAHIPTFKKEIEKRLDAGLKVVSAEEIHADIFKIINIERLSIYFILGFILLVASFNTFASVMMMLIDKKSAIQLFSSLGLKISKVREIFVFQGLFIGVVGCLLGLMLAFVIGLLQQEFGMIKIGTAENRWAYPIVFNVKDFIVVASITLFISYIVSVIATRINIKNRDIYLSNQKLK